MNQVAMPVVVLLLSIASCAALPPPPIADVADVSCDATAAGWVAGDRPTAEVVERARLESGSPEVRVIAPGERVAGDFRPQRLNISTDAGGAITGLACG
ncbi:MAG: I78 family peptidase inhibitor [Pseudomonadota bacterium]|nr:I78 family peptidase inhibitor [Pseudomonadota bacterium]